MKQQDYETKGLEKGERNEEIKTKTLNKDNIMEVSFLAKGENEKLARMLVAAFVTPIDPTLEELADVKTAVSEAVTNAIIHGYEESQKEQYVHMKCILSGQTLFVSIMDYGTGIADIKQAMEPMYTTKPELERSGMGFAFMEAFMDELEVHSSVGNGTEIKMKKIFGKEECVYG